MSFLVPLDREEDLLALRERYGLSGRVYLIRVTEATVFVSGCWDLFHRGHQELLQFARSLGTRLIVSVASDSTIRELKREPIVCEADRLELVRALRCVDEAFLCRGEPGLRDCFSYVRNLRPDVWVVNAGDPILAEKRKLAEEVGSSLVLNYRPEAGTSTTGLIARVKAL